MKKLIVDSGGTKTDWALTEDGSSIANHQGKGLNPNTHSIEHIKTELELAVNALGKVDAVVFYGAGCSTSENHQKMKALLGQYFSEARVEVHSDILAVSRALLGDGSGIVCILGTGTNSALIEGGKFIRSRPSYGYLLGDEGSGTHIGKCLLKAFLEQQFSEETMQTLAKDINISEQEIVKALYGSDANVAKFFGSFAPVAQKYQHLEEVNALIEGALAEFVSCFIKVYAKQSKQREVYAVGSVAHHFQAQLSSVLEKEGYLLKKVLQKPMEGLLGYHSRG